MVNKLLNSKNYSYHDDTKKQPTTNPYNGIKIYDKVELNSTMTVVQSIRYVFMSAEPIENKNIKKGPVRKLVHTNNVSQLSFYLHFKRFFMLQLSDFSHIHLILSNK